METLHLPWNRPFEIDVTMYISATWCNEGEEDGDDGGYEKGDE